MGKFFKFYEKMENATCPYCGEIVLENGNEVCEKGTHQIDHIKKEITCNKS